MFTNSAFNIQHEPGESLLVARWTRNPSVNQARADYGDLLSMARSYHKCRFWLMSLQERKLYLNEFYNWYTQTFAPLAVRTLGHPIFIAYVCDTEQYKFAQTPAVVACQQACAEFDFYPYFFNSQTIALEWLQCQQEHDPAPGEGPVPFDEEVGCNGAA